MSNNLQKYKEAFKETFELKDTDDIDNLKYQSIDSWDSIGHMTLMSALESAFSITLETDDIIDFSSFKKGKEILKKYKVSI
jgi:acyl carrier protein